MNHMHQDVTFELVDRHNGNDTWSVDHFDETWPPNFNRSFKDEFSGSGTGLDILQDFSTAWDYRSDQQDFSAPWDYLSYQQDYANISQAFPSHRKRGLQLNYEPRLEWDTNSIYDSRLLEIRSLHNLEITLDSYTSIHLPSFQPTFLEETHLERVDFRYDVAQDLAWTSTMEGATYAESIQNEHCLTYNEIELGTTDEVSPVQHPRMTRSSITTRNNWGREISPTLAENSEHEAHNPFSFRALDSCITQIWDGLVTTLTERYDTDEQYLQPFNSLGNGSGILISPDIAQKRHRDSERFKNDVYDDEQFFSSYTNNEDEDVAQNSEHENQIKRGFACPFRKYKPQVYCIPEWRLCALTSFNNMSRLKQHLERKHMVVQCLCCKSSFDNIEDLKRHSETEVGCGIVRNAEVDGITPMVLQRLKARKRTSRKQGQEDRWVEMYKLLSPGAIVPDPYFIPVKDAATAQQTSELGTYQQYLARELPKAFYQVAKGRLEKKLLDEMCEIMKLCHDRIALKYQQIKKESSLPLQGNDVQLAKGIDKTQGTASATLNPDDDNPHLPELQSSTLPFPTLKMSDDEFRELLQTINATQPVRAYDECTTFPVTSTSPGIHLTSTHPQIQPYGHIESVFDSTLIDDSLQDIISNKHLLSSDLQLESDFLADSWSFQSPSPYPHLDSSDEENE